MPTALESKTALKLITDNANVNVRVLLSRLHGTPEQMLRDLLEAVPQLILYFQDGSAALAADLFDDLRDAAGVRRRFRADPVILDRIVKIRNAVVWAAQPLAVEKNYETAQRLEQVLQKEIARPYRDTITVNTDRDPYAVGWKRITGVCCNFCLMLSDRGAVYKASTARFAAHDHCDCTAAPVFRGQAGPEASVTQYRASQRNHSARERAQLREYLAANYPE